MDETDKCREYGLIGSGHATARIVRRVAMPVIEADDRLVTTEDERQPVAIRRSKEDNIEPTYGASFGARVVQRLIKRVNAIEHDLGSLVFD
jgi:hypothetical protein